MPCGLVVAGASLGGTEALSRMLESLPVSFPAPIALVLHRGPTSDDVGIAQVLGRRTKLRVVEAEDKTPLEPGCVYVAPSDYHLLVDVGFLALSTEAKVNYARPSIDVLFESAADTYGSAVVGVVLTGTSADGAKGAQRIRSRGGRVVVQQPSGAEARQMPMAAMAAGEVDRVMAVEEIGRYLELCCLT